MKKINNIINNSLKIEKLYQTNLNEFDLFIELVHNNFNNCNEKLIRKAFFINIDANNDRILRSGLPSYTLNLSNAKLLCTLIKLDDISIISALLVDVSNKNSLYDFNYLKKEFGVVVAEIVDGINQIKYIETNSFNKKEYLENYRQLLFSLFKDVRIILIKLLERILLMRDLIYFTKEEQNKIGSETLEIYVPFANRFGLIQIKSELEDLSFKYLFPKEYEELESKIFGTLEDRTRYIEEFISPVQNSLKLNNLIKSNNINFEIYGRAKHLFSIYNKIKIRATPLENLNDIVAMRIIIESYDPNMCYYVYGLVTQIYPPIPETFKDYIALPKSNGYQSLHVALLGPQGKPVELQIRTKLMHETAENGIAAHFIYKSGFVNAQSVLNNKNALDWMESVKELLENSHSDDPEELLETIKNNMFLDEIHVFSPKNHVFTFNKSATALDFAYNIHSELGLSCIGAKANGKLVPLDYKMKSGDQIEVITSNNVKIDKSTLNLVSTSKSKSFILKYLKNQEKKNATEGQNTWENELFKKKIKISKENFLYLITNLGFINENDFYINYYKGNIDKNLIFNSIIYGPQTKIRKELVSKENEINTANNHNKINEEIKIDNINLNLEKNKILFANNKYTLTIIAKNSNDLSSILTDNIIDIDDLVLHSIENDVNEIELKGIYIISFEKDIEFHEIYKRLIGVHGVTKILIK
jgi:guanosine-3',5'-bis(diphosphate) 3'-pyrophosphohydrolase